MDKNRKMLLKFRLSLTNHLPAIIAIFTIAMASVILASNRASIEGGVGVFAAAAVMVAGGVNANISFRNIRRRREIDKVRDAADVVAKDCGGGQP